MELTIPELSLVLLVGPSGCGKSTFARTHFRHTEVISSDFYRGVVSDDEANQAASREAFELVHLAVRQRLRWRRLTVVDATNIQADARKELLEIARRYHYLTCAIVFELAEEVCHTYNQSRPGRVVPGHVITNHVEAARKAARAVEKEHFTHRYFLRSPEEVAAARIRRVRIPEDRRDERGPFDVIGDVHGCIDELMSLFTLLGYQVGHYTGAMGQAVPFAVPPDGRKAVFVGDLGDRGPDTPSVFRLVMDMCRAGFAICTMGNHDNKLMRYLRGGGVQPTHGLALTIEQLAPYPPEFLLETRSFLEALPTHLVLDNGRLVVAHAGLRDDLHGRSSPRVRSFALFGDTTGETDDNGLPVRLNWAGEYRGRALVVYGHTPAEGPLWQGETVNIDTGCVFGHRLTALRYPERELVSVPAWRTYAEPLRGLLTLEDLTGQPGPGPIESPQGPIGEGQT
jgi:protein phosphatase